MVGAREIELAGRLADVAGGVIRPFFRAKFDHEAKPDATPVTEADRAAEAAIRAILYVDCPTDAIIGSNKRMHTVIEPWCTGCELCIPVCPVDCIQLENVTGERTGWAAWSQAEADTALRRYEARQVRLVRETREHDERQVVKAEMKLADLPTHTKVEEGPGAQAELDRKRAIIEAALAKARAKQAQR